MPDETKNVFISHIHEDDDALRSIKDLLSQKGIQIRDSSINSSNPNNAQSEQYIKSEILAPQIQWAGTFIAYITPDTKYSTWVNWEIEYAHKIGKRIVGVWALGANECEVPDALDQYADAVVGWNSGRIMDAINGDLNDWLSPTGEVRAPRPIKRYGC